MDTPIYTRVGDIVFIGSGNSRLETEAEHEGK